MARLKKGTVSASLCLLLMSPCEYAFRASSEGVVASASGVSNFSTVLSDSPSSARIKNFFFLCCLRLLLRQYRSRPAVHGIEPDHILAAQSHDQSRNVSLAV